MKSTLKKDFNRINGEYVFGPKIYPDWYGIPNIGFIYHNDWADPELEYKGHVINSFIVEDTMWERFIEDIGGNDRDAFDRYMRENMEDVYELMNLAIGEEPA